MKHSNCSRLFTAIMAISALMISLPAVPALAAESFTLSANQAALGQQITVTGAGFPTSNISRGVNILFGEFPGDAGATMDYLGNVYQKVQVAEINSDGTFSGSFAVPARLDSGTTKKIVTRGNYYIWLTYYFPTFDSPDQTSVILVKPFSVVAGLVTISPDNGTVGTEVTLTGSFFGPSEPIVMNYDGLAVSYAGSTLTTAGGSFGPAKLTIPPGVIGKHFITVTGTGSGNATQVVFTVKPKVFIDPDSGAAGLLVNSVGSGFAGQADVAITFAGVSVAPARTDANGSFFIVFPALQKTAGKQPVLFTDGAGNSANATFTLTATTFGVTPDNGKAGSSPTVSGSGFLPSRQVSIGLNGATVATATTSGQGDFSTAFNVPAMASGTYKLTGTDGTSSNTADFTVLSSMELSPETLSAPGHVGTELTVRGVGFDAGTTVVISYDGVTVATATAAGDKSFSGTFTVPASPAGDHTVTATASSGAGQETATFVMESNPPPAPAPLKPEAGAKASENTLFDWQNVNDPSGVTYTLQVATTQDFVTTSIGIEKTGLEESQYALPPGQQLKDRTKDSPYYWRVRAVDGAGNVGEWSSDTFYVGGLLSTTVIYLIGGIAVVVVVVLAFWIGKRTSSR